jgi:hypothetical protein
MVAKLAPMRIAGLCPKSKPNAAWPRLSFSGEQDMALLSIRVKQNIGRVGEVLGWIFVLSLVLGPWIAWFIGEPYRHHIVREGELCGPGQRWTYAQPKFADSDLSCEPE